MPTSPSNPQPSTPTNTDQVQPLQVSRLGVTADCAFSSDCRGLNHCKKRASNNPAGCGKFTAGR